MKKILLTLFATITMVSCSSSDNGDEPFVKEKSYQIENECVFKSEHSPDLNGTLYTPVVLEYDKNDEVIQQDQLGDISPNTKSRQIVADKNCTYIIITFFRLPRKLIYESINKRTAVVEKFYLKDGEIRDITIDNNTNMIVLNN